MLRGRRKRGREYIGYYNTKRISTTLGGLTPLQCRGKHAQAT
ncbi:IS3 family transposase [Massilia sp. 9I]